MTDGHCFISYSTADALDFARKLVNKLEGGTPNIPVWFDKDDLKPSADWDIQIDHALKTCRIVLFVMTADSTHEKSVCRQEWSRALGFKKPIIPLWVQDEIDVPFRLQDRQRIDFRKNFDAGLAQLRDYLAWLDSPEGVLRTYKDRLLDAERDLHRAKDEDKPRIQLDIEELTKQIETQEKIVDNPEAAQEQTNRNIEAGLERERKPPKPTAAETKTKFINPPPGVAPTYFQDRAIENQEVVKFLKDDAQTMLTIIGRGGVGKTAMVCRLLKGLESGELPDGLGAMKVEGIVYLSESGSHRVNFANIFYDLCKLLPAETANELDAIYKNPGGSIESKMRAVLEKFTGGRVVLLLDNFEPLVDASRETCDLRDAELDEALRAFLNGTHTAVNIVITTRVAPRALNLIQPGRQRVLTLDEGLESPYAENILREMDSDGRLGLKSATDENLKRAKEKTRGFPRALEALFAILASDRYTTLEELLAMPTPVNVVEALVGEAFNRLDTNTQKVMQALAVYNRPVTPAAVDYLLAPHLPAIDSAPILQRLANMHFARKESGRFYLHPVDREFAYNLMSEGEKILEESEESDFDYDDEIRSEKLVEENKDEKSFANFDETYFKSSFRVPRKSRTDFTHYGLLNRAGDYFAQACKPRVEWKKLEDVSAQLAEFDLRCSADDFDAAAGVLLEIDFDYLFQWGHHHLMIEVHEKLQGKIQDKVSAMLCVGRLGLAYSAIGKIREFIKCEEQALKIAQEQKDLNNEAAWLGNLGIAYASLGNVHKAIEFYERALAIDREIGDLNGESLRLGDLGGAYFNLGDADKASEYFEQALSIASRIGARQQETAMRICVGDVWLFLENNQKAKEYYLQAIQIAAEMPFSFSQLFSRRGLAEIHLFQDDLVNARAAIEAVLQDYDVPENNHNASVLHGIIALRQGDEVAARGAFVRAIGQADEILSKTAEYYDALDAKGLALCGLILCRGAVPAPGQGDPAPTVNEAIETFRKARKIAPHAGVVKSSLRLFDELVKCDTKGILKDVRQAVEGK